MRGRNLAGPLNLLLARTWAARQEAVVAPSGYIELERGSVLARQRYDGSLVNVVSRELHSELQRREMGDAMALGPITDITTAQRCALGVSAPTGSTSSLGLDEELGMHREVPASHDGVHEAGRAALASRVRHVEASRRRQTPSEFACLEAKRRAFAAQCVAGRPGATSCPCSKYLSEDVVLLCEDEVPIEGPSAITYMVEVANSE